ncbi:MAG: helix-turn-helix transcriptional regulator [Oscillospiraceae bacterium]|nr:helix-turn-helix transcriptional regulator [Oscillospiraceae bacterium]
MDLLLYTGQEMAHNLLNNDHYKQHARFWEELLNPSSPYDTVFTRRRAKRTGVTVSEEDDELFTLVRIGLFDRLQFDEVEWYPMTEPLRHALVTLTALPPLKFEALITDIMRGHYWLVLRQNDKADPEERLRRFSDFCRDMGYNTDCCWLTDCTVADLRGAADRLRVISDDAGQGKGWHLAAESYQLSCGYSSASFLPLNEILVEKGCNSFFDALQKKLESLFARQKINLPLMLMLRADTERLLRKALAAKQLDASVIEDARCMELLGKAYYSPADLMQYVKAALKPIRDRFPVDATYPEPVQKIIRYLDSNPEKPYSRTVLGEIVGLNPNYLAALFKETTGQSVSSYRGMKQMELAAQLLTETKLSIAEISEKAGFGDQTYFSNAFRKQFGISPNEYRKQNRK